MTTTGSSNTAPKRLLAASRVVHQLWRTQDIKVDLTRLLQDETFARKLLVTAKVHGDAKTKAMLDDFEKCSFESGAWHTASEPASPAYRAGADGMVSAAAAWDPNYNPPVGSADPTPEAEYIPTTSPRISMTVKEGSSRGFLSRFSLSRPFEPGDVGRSSRSASPRNPDSVLGSKPSQNPPADPPAAPVDPNHKKYIGGAR